MGSSVSQFVAVGFALTAYTCWVLVDTSIKIAGASALPAYEVTAFIGFAIAVFLLIHALCRRNLRALWPRDPTRQFLRSLLELANGVGVVIALRHMALALFYILIFFAPLVTTLLAAVLLRERLEWRKGMAILTGFLGVVIAVDPLHHVRAGDWAGYAACTVCVLCFSANIVWSRVLTQTESPESLTFFSGVVMATLGSGAMLWRAAPLNASLAAVLAAAGLFSVFGSMCFFIALRHSSAATVSQYHYSQLLTGAGIAYVIWHEGVSSSMLLGATLILAAGSYTAANAYRRRSPLPGMERV